MRGQANVAVARCSLGGQATSWAGVFATRVLVQGKEQRTMATITFGLSLDPSVDLLKETRQLAQAADATGLEYIAIQDHAYNRDFTIG
jgi:hypothetical protein